MSEKCECTNVNIFIAIIKSGKFERTIMNIFLAIILTLFWVL